MESKGQTNFESFLYWPKPKSKSLTASSDLRLYYEALLLAKKQGFFTKSELREELGDRVKGLSFIKDISPTGLEKLVSELRAFNWINSYVNPEKNLIGKDTFTLSELGAQAIAQYQNNKRLFLQNLISQMHREYTIPGWFVHRLWKLNPDDQGQVVIPAPLKNWNPSTKLWNENSWNDELHDVTVNTYETIQRYATGSFTVNRELWLKEVEKVWTRLSYRKLKASDKNEAVKKIRSEKKRFSPRLRLTLAMREASIIMLFSVSPPSSEQKDFENFKYPLLPRSYMAWCPRLDELELIFYTDFNLKIPGRILFPVSAFKNKNVQSANYEQIAKVENLKEEVLCLHRPKWHEMRNEFFDTLYTEHQRIFKTTKALYVSVQDLRDEVCRILRLSSNLFNEFLERAFEDTIKSNSNYTISLETDIREDQRSGFQLQRRPVIVNTKIVSLIAITTH